IKYLGGVENKLSQKIEEPEQPPPGWSPYGESVTDSKKVDKDVQLESRRSVDLDIKDKDEWIREQERLRQEQERGKQPPAPHDLGVGHGGDYTDVTIPTLPPPVKGGGRKGGKCSCGGKND
ncbi:hypothetical protein KA005_19395, partial [bacterium]|nr:hypothetical protein [bacterium]